MTEMVCAYPGNRDETLVAYLYDDMAPADRAAFGAHVAACGVCRAELAGFASVRSRLAEWAPPEPTRAFAQPNVRRSTVAARVWATLRDVPAWMQVAAAVLFLGVAAGAANLNIRYNADGLSIRTGWSAPANEARVVAAPASAPPIAAASTPEPSVSKADLIALERQLRHEVEAGAAASPTVSLVRALIADSERKQQNELALRIASVYQDVGTQRTADLVKIDRILSALQNNTRSELARQRDDMHSVSTVVARLVKNP
jgi:hypothetical protein